MSKNIHRKHELLEARGLIPQGLAMSLTYATIAEGAMESFYRGYYGEALDKEASVAKSEQRALDISDSLIGELHEVLKVQKKAGLLETHTTADLPLALSSLRLRSLRQQYEGQQSTWRTWGGVTTRTVDSFEPLRGLRLSEPPELRLRPEGTDVQYATISETEDGYRIANYERAFAYTWEMWLADRVQFLNATMAGFGRGAARTEAQVILAALISGISRSVESGVTTGAPSITTLSNARTAFSKRTFTDADGKTIRYGRRLTDLIFSLSDEDAVLIALGTQFTNFHGGAINPIQGAFTIHGEPHLDEALSRAGISQRDWFAFDRNSNWFEVAFLEGFQGGAKIYTKLPNVQDNQGEGSFENHTLAFKYGIALGAKVIDTAAAIRVQGA